MKKELIQKRGLLYRKHYLLEDRVIVEYKTLQKVGKYEVNLSDLGSRKTYQSANTLPGKIMFVLCLAMTLGIAVGGYLEHTLSEAGTIFGIVIGLALTAFSYLKPHQNDIYLMGGKKNLVFYENIPNEQAVIAFMDDIIEANKRRMKEKYVVFDEYTSEREYSHMLSWLKTEGIISDKELEDYTAEFKTSRLF